jgi:hypothetical protein
MTTNSCGALNLTDTKAFNASAQHDRLDVSISDIEL